MEKGKQIGGEEKRRLKRRKMFGEGNIFFVEKMKNGYGKGDKYHGEGKIVAN